MDYQKSLESIRSCVNDIMLPAGWRQLVRGHTRAEPGHGAATLDHIYTNAVDRTERTWNQNCSGYDHNLVGVRIKSHGTIFRAETFEYRDLKNVSEETFAEATSLPVMNVSCVERRGARCIKAEFGQLMQKVERLKGSGLSRSSTMGGCVENCQWVKLTGRIKPANWLH
mgnify:CR=1 FL=1